MNKGKRRNCHKDWLYREQVKLLDDHIFCYKGKRKVTDGTTKVVVWAFSTLDAK